MSVYYVGIGNSDDKLTQQEWAALQHDVMNIFDDHNVEMIGYWHSLPDSMYQNACYCIVADLDKIPEMKGQLAALATIFRQDAIAWSEAPLTEMLGPTSG